MSKFIEYEEDYVAKHKLYSEFYSRIGEEVIVFSAISDPKFTSSELLDYQAKFYFPSPRYSPRYPDSVGKLLEMRINDGMLRGNVSLNPSMYSDKKVMFSGHLANEKLLPDDLRDDFFKMAYTEAYYDLEYMYTRIVSENLFDDSEEHLVRSMEDILGFFYANKSEDDYLFQDHKIIIIS